MGGSNVLRHRRHIFRWRDLRNSVFQQLVGLIMGAKDAIGGNCRVVCRQIKQSLSPWAELKLEKSALKVFIDPLRLSSQSNNNHITAAKSIETAMNKPSWP